MEFPTTSKATVKGLVTGVKQWFQVAANGSHGLGPWSEPVAGTPFVRLDTGEFLFQ